MKPIYTLQSSDFNNAPGEKITNGNKLCNFSIWMEEHTASYENGDERREAEQNRIVYFHEYSAIELSPAESRDTSPARIRGSILQ